jgi:hypothetical protein
MVLLKCLIDGPSSTSTNHQKGRKTVDATHPLCRVLFQDQCAVGLASGLAVWRLASVELLDDQFFQSAIEYQHQSYRSFSPMVLSFRFLSVPNSGLDRGQGSFLGGFHFARGSSYGKLFERGSYLRLCAFLLFVRCSFDYQR